MSAEGDVANPRTGAEAVAAAGRWISAVLLAGALGAVVFLIVAGQARDRGYTDITFNHSLGVMVGGAATEARSDRALGVAGDTAGPTGLLWSVVLGALLVALFAVTVHRYLRRHWALQGIVLGVAAWLLVSLVYFPLLDRNPIEQVSVSPFGFGAGGGTPVVFLVASLAFGLLAARVFTLVVHREWWREKVVDHESALRGIEGMEDLRSDPLDPDRPRGSGGMVPPAGF